MEITVDIVDWNVVNEKVNKGTLPDDLIDIEGDEEWIRRSTKWFNESFSSYCTIAFAFESRLPTLDERNRNACDNSLSLLINETADMPKELVEYLDPEYYVGSLSPETVANIYNSYNQINQDSLSADLPAEVMEYVKDWVNVLEEAMTLKRGIIVQVI